MQTPRSKYQTLKTQENSLLGIFMAGLGQPERAELLTNTVDRPSIFSSHIQTNDAIRKLHKSKSNVNGVLIL